MELWIRSQDKTNLIVAKDIVVSNGNIKVYKDTKLCTTVAMYKTKERALEVLDEIQEILCPKKPKSVIGKNVEFVPALFYVYEMPEE